MNTNFKKKKTYDKKIPSIENLHLNKIKYFEQLQKSLIKKQKLLQELEGKERKLLEEEIEKIKNKEEENHYWLSCHPIYVEYEMCNEQDSIETNGFIEISSNSKKQELFEEYLLSIDRYDLARLMKPGKQMVYSCKCPGEPDLLEELSFIVCKKCGNVLGQTISNSYDLLSYKEVQEMEYGSHYYYKRMNHFSECLAQLQSKENTTIPEEIFECVKNEALKKRLPLKNLTLKMVKSFLKKNNFSKYTENSHNILYKLTGEHKISLPLQLEEKLKQMFTNIQEPFEKYKGKRKNFLNYNYCFYKFFELLGLPEYLEFFPLLKDRHKLSEHDIIWKKICEDMEWEFKPCR